MADTIVISEEVGVQKPQPEIFDLVLRNLEHSGKKDVLMIVTVSVKGG